jgi:hypothetical protein
MSSSEVPSACCCYDEHLSRIFDLESRLSLLKCQVKKAMDQAGKSFGLMMRGSLPTRFQDKPTHLSFDGIELGGWC